MDTNIKINTIVRYMKNDSRIMPMIGRIVCSHDIKVPMPKRKMEYQKFCFMSHTKQIIFVLKQMRFHIFGQHAFFNEKLISLLLKAIELYLKK
jgi:hypothetical protein